LNAKLTHLNIGYTNIGSKGIKLISKAFKLNNYVKLGNERLSYINEMLKVNKILTELHVQGNDITHTTIMNEALKRLDIRNNEIDAEVISEGLKVNTMLAILILDKFNIDDKGAKGISEILKINKTLEALSLRDYKIADEDPKIISERLKVGIMLKELVISFNCIESLKPIREAFLINKVLERLNLADDSHYNDVEELKKVLRRNFRLI